MSLRCLAMTVLLVLPGACTPAASGHLAIAVEGSGTTNPSPGSHAYGQGTSVQVTATPSGGSTFLGWSGAVTGTANPVSVVVDGSMRLVAVFSAVGGGSDGGGDSSGGEDVGGDGGTPSADGGAGSDGGGGGGADGGCQSNPGDGGATVSINAGGSASEGFSADGYFSGGDSFSTTNDIDTSGIACNAPPAAVFQTERYGEFTYTLSRRAPASSQTVTLYFAESYWTKAGQRTFDVVINGTTVLSAFDIFDAAGAANKAVAKTFTTTADDKGRVVIQFSPTGPDNPKVCAITVSGEAAPAPDGGGDGPCDIYEAGGTPCVAAHSTVRALYGAYDGNLYQVKRSSDNTTQDIPVLAPGGFADSAQQDTFCANTSCIISIIYDQSSRGNHLTPAPGGSGIHTPSDPVNAAKLKLSVGGHSVYAAYFEGKMGYRNNSTTTGLAKGEDPESMYMVTSGTHYNGGCCFDYGNAETTTDDDGEGTMEALYFGTTSWGHGGGNGPWVMTDLENGVWAGNTNPYAASPSITYGYVTAVLKGKSGAFALRAGDSQSGTMTTLYEGARPVKGAWGGSYNPMRKEGAIILGIGGDNSNDGVGTFYEGCITTGYTSDDTDEAVQANIVAAGYGG